MKDIYKPLAPTTEATRLNILGASRLILGNELQASFVLPSLNTGDEIHELPQRVQITQRLDKPGCEIKYTTLAGEHGPEKTHRHITIGPYKAKMWYITELDEQVGQAIAVDLDSQLPDLK